MLYTLNVHNVICQLYLNKAGEKKKAYFLVVKNICSRHCPKSLSYINSFIPHNNL